MLLLEGLGPRTLQSMALIAKVIHGDADALRRSRALLIRARKAKDGHPFPVPLKIYDESFGILRQIQWHSLRQSIAPQEGRTIRFVHRRHDGAYFKGNKFQRKDVEGPSGNNIIVS